MKKILNGQKVLWGSATAAYQCEGAWNTEGKGNNIWDDFCHSERNTKAITGDVSCDFYHHYEEDIRKMKECGQTTYRFSISWSRILPKNDGVVNQSGLDFYHRVLDECTRVGIIPNVTLVHYDLPDYLGECGWEDNEIANKFAAYCAICFKEFGDKVPYWVTINEPSHNAFCSYMVGNYPPNVQDPQRLCHVAYNMMVANAKAISEFRKLKCDGQIGIVHAGCRSEVLKDEPMYQEARRWADLYFNKWVLDTAILGYFSEELINKLNDSNIDMSFVKAEDLKIISENKVDFLGQNIYARRLVKPYVSGETCSTVNNDPKNCKNVEGTTIKGWFEPDSDSSVKRNPWGREVYPKCGYNTLMHHKAEYGNLPIFITENGHGMFETADENGYVEDDERIAFLDAFLDCIVDAINEGCNVQGYYVWSTMDLYSWINGYEKRYGLVRVDYENGLKRIPKKSYYWYRDFIQFQNKI